MRTVRSVCKEGAIHLLEPIDLPEHQEVTVIIPDSPAEEHPVLRYAGMLSDLTPEQLQAFDEILQKRPTLSRSVEL